MRRNKVLRLDFDAVFSNFLRGSVVEASDIEPEPLGRLIEGVQKVTRAVLTALVPDGVVVSTVTERPGV